MGSAHSLPPGPRNALVQTLHYAKDTYGFLEACRRKYGNIFTVPTLNGTIVFTADPAGAQEIYSADPSILDAFGSGTLEPFLGQDSLFLTGGEVHKRDRKLLSPPFQAARMPIYHKIIQEATRTAFSALSPGQTFIAQELTQWISLEVLLRAIFGIHEQKRVDLFRERILAMVAGLTPAMLFFPFLRKDWFGLSPWPRVASAIKQLDELIFEELAARRSSQRFGEDVLSLMLTARYDDGSCLSDKQLRDHLSSLLFAGYETTAIALAWAFYWLARYPHELDRLERELDAAPSIDALSEQPYVEAVCREALRIYPVVSDRPRTLKQSMVLQGYNIPAGYAVSVCTSLIHMRDDLYPSSYTFKPERFLGKIPPSSEYNPFGGGSRRCLGAPFAFYEMKVVLAMIVNQYKLKLEEEENVMPYRRNVVYGPNGGVRMRFLGKRASAKTS